MATDDPNAELEANPEDAPIDPKPWSPPPLPTGEEKQDELKTLARLGLRYMWDEEAHRVVQDGGVLFGPNRFYSQIPSIRDVENSFEYDPQYTDQGPWWDDSLFDLNHLRSVMRKMEKQAAKFDPPMDGDLRNPDGYFWKNPAFAFSDALSYYAMIRMIRPKHVVEVGSGFSSLVAAQALKDTRKGKLTCIEPYPMPWMRDALPKMTLIEERIQDIDPARLNAMLSDGDIFFIDSTHTVKAGSDCTWIYLKLLPAIDKDITVHVHDIPLPFAFGKDLGVSKHIHWVEPYLLMAYLLDNPRITVQFSSSIAKHILKAEGLRLMGGKYPPGGGSLWFTQNARTDPAG